MAAKDDLRDWISSLYSPSLSWHLSGLLPRARIPAPSRREPAEGAKMANAPCGGGGVAGRESALHGTVLRLREACIGCVPGAEQTWVEGEGVGRWLRARINSALRQMKSL